MKQAEFQVLREKQDRLHLITSVFCDDDMSEEEVRESLINHDGYPTWIIVRKVWRK